MVAKQQPEYKKGDRVAFKGYTDKNMPEDQKFFEQGDELEITNVSVDPDGVSYDVVGLAGDRKAQNLFDDEVQALEIEESQSEEVVEEKPKKKTKKAKTSKKKVEEQPVEVTPEEAVEDQPVEEAEVAPKPSMTSKKSSEVVSTAAMQEVTSGTPTEVMQTATDLVNKVNETFFTLGGVLAYIHAEGIYKTLGDKYAGNKGFALYVEEHLDIKYGKAMDLIKIYSRFTELGLDEKRITEIGWSKARVMASYANADNFDEILDLAANNTRDELLLICKKDYVNVSTGEKDELTERMASTKFNFHIFGDQAEVVQQALDVALGKMDEGIDKNLNMAFFYIVSEWVSTFAEGEVETDLEDEIAMLEMKYGVRLALEQEGEEDQHEEQAA